MRPLRFPRVAPKVAAVCRTWEEIRRYCNDPEYRKAKDELIKTKRLKSLIAAEYL